MFAVDTKTLKAINLKNNIIDQGRTSLILEHENTQYVKCITRDYMKYKWYEFINFGHLIKTYKIDDSKDIFHQFPVYEIDVPKLDALSNDKRSEFRQILMYLKKYQKISYQLTNNLDEQNLFVIEKILAVKSTFYPLFLELYNFTKLYAKDFLLDINMSNIMNYNDNMIFIDPVFSLDLLSVFLPYCVRKPRPEGQGYKDTIKC